MDSRSALPVSSRRARVLVAEQDPEMRAVIRDVLTEDGHDIIECAEPRAVLASLEDFDEDATVDVVISSASTRGYSGIDVLRVARERRVSARFVLLTSFAEPALRARLLSFGAAVLDKPFDISELRAAVADAVAHR